MLSTEQSRPFARRRLIVSLMPGEWGWGLTLQETVGASAPRTPQAR